MYDEKKEALHLKFYFKIKNTLNKNKNWKNNLIKIIKMAFICLKSEKIGTNVRILDIFENRNIRFFEEFYIY